MGHMKTTIEISDPLLREARRLAAREGLTLRALVERGLSLVVRENRMPTSFKLRRAAYKGSGLQPEFRDADGQKLIEAAYEGRGG